MAHDTTLRYYIYRNRFRCYCMQGLAVVSAKSLPGTSCSSSSLDWCSASISNGAATVTSRSASRESTGSPSHPCHTKSRFAATREPSSTPIQIQLFLSKSHLFLRKSIPSLISYSQLFLRKSISSLISSYHLFLRKSTIPSLVSESIPSFIYLLISFWEYQLTHP